MSAAAGLQEKVRELGPWFHDLQLGGVSTAPEHPLGGFLQNLWSLVMPAFPADMRGLSVLDIGCNAGFYSLKLHARGARVTGIDHDERYLAQARFAAEWLGVDIEYRQLDAYDADLLGRTFDYVLFMGVLYHLRHPLLALDKVARLPRRRLIFQSMIRGPAGKFSPQADYPIEADAAFDEPGFPAMYFIERSYAGDPTNWWIPNAPCIEAMLRSAGLRIDAHPAREVYFCSRSDPGVT
ncbi:MAG: TIGR04290 family methyltransferase [Gemmatimonadota bacterium]